MNEAFDGLPPEPSKYRTGGDPRPDRSRRVAFAIVGVFLSLAATLAILEAVGVHVWPRNETGWERHTVRTLPGGRGTCDVFHSRRIPRDDAVRLGAALEREGFFDVDHVVSVFVTRDGGEYAVSFFIDWQRFDEAGAVPAFEALRAKLRWEVFDGQPLVVNLCDQEVRGGLDPGLTIRRQLR